jgi:hypothetical protein
MGQQRTLQVEDCGLFHESRHAQGFAHLLAGRRAKHHI